ncbi:MAG: Kdo hydroxylase family protein [Chlamydiales bacterium]|jgi:hypothetical protein|nr:Kdo hydroxylase family protein [Chlamydiales bacterium]
MAQLITVEEVNLQQIENPQRYCKELEKGNILFFPKCPFDFPQEELDFLLSQKQTGAAHRKNIAYKPQSNKITNVVALSEEQKVKMLDIMQSYSRKTMGLLAHLLAPYADKWKLDYASFRPFQEKSRPLRTRARNDLLHVDSFPSRPVHGDRILRFFTNINPLEKRYWITSDPFETLAELFRGTNKLSFPPGVHETFSGRFIRALKKRAHKLGLPITLRSPYDSFMLNLHHFLKENEEFQENCPKDHWEFPPHSCWVVFTDQVSHAAISGQYALEQTVIVPRLALIRPETAPVSILEKITKSSMVDSLFLGH